MMDIQVHYSGLKRQLGREVTWVPLLELLCRLTVWWLELQLQKD